VSEASKANLPFLREHRHGIAIDLHVQPGASASELAGVHAGRLKIRLAAPPVDGKANQELIRFLAKQLDIRKSQLAIIAGNHSRDKTVLVTAGSRAELSSHFADQQP